MARLFFEQIAHEGEIGKLLPPRSAEFAFLVMSTIREEGSRSTSDAPSTEPERFRTSRCTTG
jgi:hypothetical protein